MEFLKYFITEEIYLVPDNRQSKQESEKTEAPEANIAESDEAAITEEPAKKEAEVDYPLTVVSAPLNEDEEKLLGAILKAVDVKFSDIAVLNKENDQLQSKKVLVFGHAYYNQLPLYKAIVQDDKEFLKADELSTINKDVEKKRKLWGCLKGMFSV
ncbi:MAG: DNA polymerase III subunit psi [Candidatus Cyclobacteriaceae bacterium M2_1C_046]